MENSKEKLFKELCKAYFQEISLEDLRRYGRHLELQKPTTLKKEDLINEILLVICDEKKPSRNLRGAPIKNTSFLPEIPLQIEKFREEIFGISYNIENTTINKNKNKENFFNNLVVLNLSLSINELTKEQKQLTLKLLESLTK